MKEFEPIKEQSDKIKIVNQRQVDYEKRFIGSTKRYNGHTFYEINCTTGVIAQAEFKEEKILLTPNINILTGEENGTDSILVKEVDCKENCIYIAALNKVSARKKYLKWLLASKHEKIKSNK